MDELNFLDFSRTIVIPRLCDGMLITIQLTLMSGMMGLILGLPVALLRLSSIKFLSWIATAYITLFRGTPLLLQILF